MKTSLPSLLFLSALLTFPGSSSGQDAASLIAEGDRLDASMKTEAALETYLEAEKLQPDDPDLLIKIATQYGESMVDAASAKAEQSAGEKALSYARRALALAPDMADAHLAVAICYGRLLDFMSAREKVEYSRQVKVHAEKATALNPSSDYAWHMLGRWHRAVADTNALLKGVVEIVYGGLPPASYEESAKALEKAASLAPERVAHRIELGITYAEMGEDAKARTEIKKGLALPDRERDDPNTKARGRAVLAELGG